MQCKGTTKKGLRCKIQCPSGYCRYHEHQARPGAKQSQTREPRASHYSKAQTTPEFAPVTAPAPAPSTSSSPGFIYIYTLASPSDANVYNPKKRAYVPLQKNALLRIFSSEKILIKVGFTTNAPLKRIAQWEAQCKHKLVPVEPKHQRRAPHYDPVKCGWQSQNAFQVEQNILRVLRERFGAGKVECAACAKQGKNGVHVEWFMMKKKSVKNVFTVIEEYLVV